MPEKVAIDCQLCDCTESHPVLSCFPPQKPKSCMIQAHGMKRERGGKKKRENRETSNQSAERSANSCCGFMDSHSPKVESKRYFAPNQDP